MMRNLLGLSLVFIIGFGIISCSEGPKRNYKSIDLSFEDPEYIRILVLQDKLLADSLYSYFDHENPAYRFASARALASIKDPKSIIYLKNLLNDPFDEIKEAAAYSIGQSGNSRGEPYLIDAFSDSVKVNAPSNAAILEALGKIGTKETQKLISTISSYTPTDTTLLVGQAKSLYRFALRGMTSVEGTETMVKYISGEAYPQEVKLWASNYLARSNEIDISDHQFQIANELGKNPDPDIRMALALSLRKSDNSEILSIIWNQIKSESDYRVIVNAIRALGSFEYIEVVEEMLNLLNHESSKVSNLAAQYLIDHGKAGDALIYKDYISENTHWLSRAKVYQAINKHLPRNYSTSRYVLTREIKEAIESSDNPYEIVAYYNALAEDPLNYRYIFESGFQHESAAVRTASIAALSEVFKNPLVRQIYGRGERRIKLEIIDYMKQAIGSKDVGMISVAAEFFNTRDIELKSYTDESDFLREAQEALVLPKDIEAYKLVQSALDYFLNNPPSEPKVPSYNHPIPFDILKTISDSTNFVMKTNRGNILIELYPKRSPGSVANFVNLVNNGYYNGKNIHRVVPNFVIQGGCPKGDGYGSLNYSIRSELTDLNYSREGLLGMASAGNHTECSQWFITHSPAPYLDGNYTIFGRVIQGMEVVHAIEQGDIINSITIK